MPELHLTNDWLEAHEVNAREAAGSPDAGPCEHERVFRTEVWGQKFEVVFRHLGDDPPFAGALTEDPRRPEEREILVILARAWLGSQPRPRPDAKAAWEAYRRQMLETGEMNELPGWDEISSGNREAFELALRTAAAGGDEPLLHPGKGHVRVTRLLGHDFVSERVFTRPGVFGRTSRVEFEIPQGEGSE